MQSPKPTNATGVPVTLSYVDPNNNYNVIGTTTSDANGQYTYTFKPNIPGTYQIVATFAGSESYFTSTAQTHMNFLSPAPTTTSPTPQPASMADTYFLPMSIITIVAIIVIGALLVALMLRKRP